MSRTFVIWASPFYQSELEPKYLSQIHNLRNLSLIISLCEMDEKRGTDQLASDSLENRNDMSDEWKFLETKKSR